MQLPARALVLYWLFNVSSTMDECFAMDSRSWRSGPARCDHCEYQEEVASPGSCELLFSFLAFESWALLLVVLEVLG
jgi:hypothetical protein